MRKNQNIQLGMLKPFPYPITNRLLVVTISKMKQKYAQSVILSYLAVLNLLQLRFTKINI